MSRALKSAQLCCVSIGYQDFLLPTAEGMKLVALLQNAMACEDTFDGEQYVYVVKKANPEVVFKSVRHAQVRMPEGEIKPARAPKALQIGRG